MNLLLDAHVFLWHIANDSRLPVHIAQSIRQKDNVIYVSAASIWELALKNLKGKLPLAGEPFEYLTSARIKHQMLPLPIDEAALRHLATLPKIHADPFDRIMICQALEHSLKIVTTDPVIQRYPVPVLAF
jgi:PIN domain nuclease of toxin-antitoxin system